MKKIWKRIFLVSLAALMAILSGSLVSAAAKKKIYTPVPTSIKVYGAVTEHHYGVVVQSSVSNAGRRDTSYKKSYLYIKKNGKLIWKGKYKSNHMSIQIGQQRRGDHLEMYFQNGKYRTKTIHKIIVGDEDISRWKPVGTIAQPDVEFDYPNRIMSIESTPGLKIAVTGYNQPLRTATVPASGKLRLKIPKMSYGSTIWVYAYNKTGRSLFVTLENADVHVTNHQPFF